MRAHAKARAVSREERRRYVSPAYLLASFAERRRYAPLLPACALTSQLSRPLRVSSTSLLSRLRSRAPAVDRAAVSVHTLSAPHGQPV
eukprot:6193831-Pleurochrysis_carterae.AAC.1